MNRYIVLTGSNLGDREAQLSHAADLVGAQVGIVDRKSSVYETAAWGNEEQPAFLNQVISGMTSLEPQAVMELLLAIERQMGRTREGKWQPRIIDIDLLFLDQQQVKIPDLELPHPMLHRRRFTLLPLSEIFPEFRHPVLQLTIRELLDRVEDPLEVKLFRKSVS